MPRDQGAYASAKQQGANAGTVFGMDWPAVQNQINPNAATRGALTQLPMQSANAAFDAAQQNAQQRVAKTRNSAGYSELADKLAMGKGAADSTAALKGTEAVQGLQNTGIENAGKLFGISTDAQAPLYNSGAAATNASWDWTKGLDAITGAASTVLGVPKVNKAMGG